MKEPCVNREKVPWTIVLIEYYSYLCSGLHSLGHVLSLLDKFYKTTDKVAFHADMLWVKFLINKASQSGCWVGHRSPDILKAFIDAVFETCRNSRKIS